jgi:P-loop ATPase protein family
VWQGRATTRIQVVVTSFGYLHDSAPRADVTVDVRQHLRDPHTDPTLRVLTGKDFPVRRKVLSTPGALDLIVVLTDAVLALLPPADKAGRLVTLAIGCAGGRHRSVVIADSIAERLSIRGIGVEATHRDINKDIIEAMREARVRAEELVLGDVHPTFGACDEIRRDPGSPGVIGIGWENAQLVWQAIGALFTIRESESK